MKRSTRKLVIRTETLRRLAHMELRAIVGGDSGNAGTGCPVQQKLIDSGNAGTGCPRVL